MLAVPNHPGYPVPTLFKVYLMGTLDYPVVGAVGTGEPNVLSHRHGLLYKILYFSTYSTKRSNRGLGLPYYKNPAKGLGGFLPPPPYS